MTTTTWNPGDKALTDLSAAYQVSNVGATLNVTGSLVFGGVRALNSASSGKYYFEFTLGQFTDSYTAIGVTNGTVAFATIGNTANQSCLAYASGFIYLNGVSTGKQVGITGGTLGATIGCALDLDTYQIWFRQCPSGNWNNVAANNPATGVGGVSIAAIANASTPMFPIFLGGRVAGEKVIANFGDGHLFLGIPPSGFVAGFPVAGAAPPSGLAYSTIIGAEDWTLNFPDAWISQIAVEHWGVGVLGIQAAMTQMAIEMWAPPFTPLVATQTRAMILA